MMWARWLIRFFLFCSAMLLAHNFLSGGESNTLSVQLQTALRQPEAQWDLAEIALLITREEYPQMQIEPFQQSVDQLAERLKTQLKKAGTPTQRLQVLAELLFKTEGYQLPLRDDADAFLLGSVLKQKRGNCLGLSVLCLALAERCNLPLHGVPVPSRGSGPGHLLIRYDDGTTRLNFDPTEGGKAHPDTHYLELFKLKPEDLRGGYILSNATKRTIVNLLLVNLGGTRVEAGASALALPLLEKAVELKPDYAPGQNNLGAARLERGDLSGARKAYAEAKRLDLESLGPRLGLAKLALVEGRLNEAEEELALVLAVEPENAAARSLEANLHLAQQNPQAAVRMLQELAESAPKDPQAWCNLGAAALQAGLFPQAESAYRKAVQLAPQSADAQFGLGQALQATGKQAEAERCRLTALKLEPKHLPSLLKQAERARQENKLSDAQRLYEQILSSNPREFSALSGLAQTLLELKQPQAAEAHLQTALRDHPDHPGLRMQLGEAYMFSGRLKEALTVFQELLAQGPSQYHTALRQRLAACYGKSGDHRKALELAQQLLKEQPEDLTALRLAANASEGQRDARSAANYYKKILSLQPNDPQATAALKRLGVR